MAVHTEDAQAALEPSFDGYEDYALAIEQAIRVLKVSPEQAVALRTSTKQFLEDGNRWVAKWKGRPESERAQCNADLDELKRANKEEVDAILAWPNGKDPNAKPEEKASETKRGFSPEEMAKVREKCADLGPEDVEKAVVDSVQALEDCLAALKYLPALKTRVVTKEGQGRVYDVSETALKREIRTILENRLGITPKEFDEFCKNPSPGNPIQVFINDCEAALADVKEIMKEPGKRIGNLMDRKQCDELAALASAGYDDSQKKVVELRNKGPLIPRDADILNNWHTGNDTFGVVIPGDPEQRTWLGRAFKEGTSEEKMQTIIHESLHRSSEMRIGDKSRGLLNPKTPEVTYGRFGTFLIKKKDADINADNLTYIVCDIAKEHRKATEK